MVEDGVKAWHLVKGLYTMEPFRFFKSYYTSNGDWEVEPPLGRGGGGGSVLRTLCRQLGQGLSPLELLQELRAGGAASFGFADITRSFPQHAQHTVMRERISRSRLCCGALLQITEHRRLLKRRSQRWTRNVNKVWYIS